VGGTFSFDGNSYLKSGVDTHQAHPTMWTLAYVKMLKTLCQTILAANRRYIH